MTALLDAATMFAQKAANAAQSYQQIKNSANDVLVDKFANENLRAQNWRKTIAATMNKDREITLEATSASRNLLSKITF